MKLLTVTICQLMALVITTNAEKSRIYQPGNITIGVMLRLHSQASINTCGDFYSLGLGNIEAISYAVAQINKNASILRNVTLGIDVRDYCESLVLVASDAHKIVINNFLNNLTERTQTDKECSLDRYFNITSPIVAVVGTEGSTSTGLVSSYFEAVGITTISAFATSEELSSAYHSTFFRTIPPDGQQAKAMVELINRFGWQYVAVVASDGSYGRYGVKALEKESYDQKSFCIAFVEYLTRSGNNEHLKTIVKKLNRASNIKVIILWSYNGPIRRFLQEASSQRLFGRTFIVSEALAAIDKDVLEKYSDVMTGALGTIPHFYKAKGFVQHLMNLSPVESPNNPLWKEFWETEFNCTTTSLSRDFKLCDSNLTVGHRYEKLFNSYTPYLLDAVYALAHALDLMTTCKEKDPYRASCLELLKPNKLAEYMKNVSFEGLTGQVLFDDKGNPIQAHYDIVNLQQNGQMKWDIITVGHWKGKENYSELIINASAIHWSTEQSAIPVSICSKTCLPGYRQTDTVACCWECLECPEGFVNPIPGSRNCTKCHQEQMSNRVKTKCVDLPQIYVQWNDIIAIICAGLGVLGILGTLFTIGVFIIYCQTPIVKASNRELSFVMLVLILMCFTLTFLHLSRPTNTLCLVIQPWRYITCTYCVSILFLKTNRLVRAFQTKTIPSWFKKYVLDRHRQHIAVFLLNIIQIILATLWLVLDPPFLYKDIKPQQHIFLTCQTCHTSVGYGIRASMFAYLAFLSGLCTVYAFKARRLPENFNEAKFIAFAMYILLVSWVVYYPVDSSLEGAYHTFVGCATALLIAYGLLVCLFVPKLYVMLVCPDKNTDESVRADVGRFSKSTCESTEFERSNKVSPAEVTTH